MNSGSPRETALAGRELGVPAPMVRVLLAAVLCLAAPGLCACAPVLLLSDAPSGPWAFDRIEELPDPGALDGTTLAEALAGRRSVRDFEPTPLTVDQSTALLWAAQGVTAPWGGRTAPSAGALYPLEVYLVTPTGIQRYLPDEHRVQVQDNAAAQPALAVAVGQPATSAAPAVFVITGTPGRLKPKYLFRAERYTLIEAGHAAQNLLLAATAIGLGGVSIGAFDQAAVASVLGLPAGEEPIYVIPVGAPARALRPAAGSTGGPRTVRRGRGCRRRVAPCPAAAGAPVRRTHPS